MINNKADEIIGRLFKQIKNRYHIKIIWNRQKLVNLSLVIYLLSYKYLRINPNQSGLYIDSSDWTRNKKDNIESYQ